MFVCVYANENGRFTNIYVLSRCEEGVRVRSELLKRDYVLGCL